TGSPLRFALTFERMEEDLVLTYRLAYRATVRSQARRFAIFALGSALAALAPHVRDAAGPADWPFYLWLWLFVMALLPLSIWLGADGRIRKTVHKLLARAPWSKGDTRVALHEAGLHIASAMSAAEIAWPALTAVRAEPSYVDFVFWDRSHWVLPTRAFKGE